MRQGVRNENRVNVFVDGAYSFSLDVFQVVELGVKVGREITDDELLEFKKASEFGKLYQRALEWVLMRPRSERETRDYLKRKLKKTSSDALVFARRYGRDCARSLSVSYAWSSDDYSKLSDEIIARLSSRGYLDDRRFAEFYVENRFVKKGVSAKRLKMELMKKGVKKDVVDEVMSASERNDEEEILKIIAKKRAKYDDEKLIAYLCRQGFSYDLVKELVASYAL